MEKVEGYVPLPSLLSFRPGPASWLGGGRSASSSVCGNGKAETPNPQIHLRRAVVGNLPLHPSHWRLGKQAGVRALASPFEGTCWGGAGDKGTGSLR